MGRKDSSTIRGDNAISNSEEAGLLVSREKVHGSISEGIGPQESKALSMRLFLIFFGTNELLLFEFIINIKFIIYKLHHIKLLIMKDNCILKFYCFQAHIGETTVNPLTYAIGLNRESCNVPSNVSITNTQHQHQ